MKKYCIYRSCKNHSESQSRAVVEKKIFFVAVPKPRRNYDRCKKWVDAINREDISPENIKNHHYVCSKHFVGGNGPSDEFPDPIPDHHIADIKPIKDNIWITVNQEMPKPEASIVDDNSLENRSDYLASVASNPVKCYRGLISATETQQRDLIEVCRFKDAATSPILNIQRKETNYNKLETLLRDFLFYQSENLREITWCAEILYRINLKAKNATVAFKRNENLTLKILVASDMKFRIFICDKELPISHNLRESTKLDQPLTSVEDLLKIMKIIDEWVICHGVCDDKFAPLRNVRLQSSYFCQISNLFRSKKCQMLFKSKVSKLCQHCRMTKVYLQRRLKRREKATANQHSSIACPTKKITNFRYLDKGQMRKRILALKLKYRAMNRKLKVTENKISKTINKKGIFLSEDDSAEFEQLLTKKAIRKPKYFSEIA